MINIRPFLRIARRFILGLAVLAVVAAITYSLVRPWVITWGATDEEVRRTLPGDEVDPQAQVQSTRAITIQAPAEKVWPWLVQIGWGRAGFYSYNWIENLMGGDLRNADRIHPEWQDLKVGDEVWMAPPGRYGDVSKLVVAKMEPNRALVFERPGVPDSGAYVLDTIDEKTTRLIVRGRGVVSGIPHALFYQGFFEPGHFIMERGQLLEIKELAENAPSERSTVELISLWCVVIAGLGLVAMLFSRRKWPWTLFIASAGVSLWTVVFFVWYPSVMYGALLDVAILGALLWAYWPSRRQRSRRKSEVVT